MTYEQKTKSNDKSVKQFLNNVENEKRKEDSLKLLDLFTKWTKKEPKMWGTSIIGFDIFKYKTKSKIEGEWFKTGFSPRKQSLSIYIMPYIDEIEELTKQLGKIKRGKGCIYINKLEDIDIKILEKIIKLSIKKNSYNS